MQCMSQGSPIKGDGDGGLFAAAALIIGVFALIYSARRMPVSAPDSDGFAKDRENLAGDLDKVAKDMRAGAKKAEAHVR